jgi:hypothetical protein
VVKIWVDDVREPPDGWRWFTHSEDVIAWLAYDLEWVHMGFEPDTRVMSLDHDLGGDDTTRPIVLWMCENEFWPEEVYVHSANPVGVEWLEGMIERYKQ